MCKIATVQKRGDSYQITASCGYDTYGKQKRKTMTWAPEPGMTPRQIQKELERQKVLFEERCKGADVSGGNIKFEAFCRQWFKEYAEPHLKIRTVDCYHQYEARTYSAIGHLRMDKITTRTVQLFILSLSEELSSKTVKNYLSFVSTVFNYAVSQGVVASNPCRGVTLPKPDTTERDCYTLEEAQQFLELLDKEPIKWRTFFTLAIYGGFRRGELFGLEWKDIDFDSGVITIARTSLYTKDKGVFTDTTKTKSSQRSLRMPDSVMKLLRQFKASQMEDRLRVGDQWVDSDRLFVSWNGTPSNPNSSENWLHRLFNRTGMRRVGVHSFRHLNASLLINSGVDIRTGSSALGHTQTSTTLNIYAHTYAAAQAKATAAIANALELKKDGKEKTNIKQTSKARLYKI